MISGKLHSDSSRGQKVVCGLCNGSITVYLSLCLLLVVGIIFTVAESARVRAMNARAGSVAYMAADSAYSAFAQPLFDEYGVMMLWEDTDVFRQEISDYIDGNLKQSNVSEIIFADLYGLSMSETEVLEVTHPTDDAANPFADQVEEYMKVYLAEDVISRLTEGNSIFDQSEKVNDFMDTVQEYEDVFIDVEESVEDISDKIDRAKAKGRDPLHSLDEMKETLEYYINTQDGDCENAFRSEQKDLQKTQKQLKGLMDDIEKKTEKYYGYVDKAQQAVDEIEQKVEADRDSYDPEIYSLIKEQMDDLIEKSADTKADYYDVGANSQTVSDIYSRLDSLDGLFDATGQPLTGENAASYLMLVENYRSIFSEFDLEKLGVNYDISSIDKEDKGFLKSASKIFKSGLLGFIAGDVSDKSIQKGNLPSEKMTKEQKKEEKEGLISAAESKVLMSEYILTHFGNAADKLPNSALDYEAEYIIAGNKSDKDNLSAIVTDIVLMRSGCNLISLLKDSGKKAETAALATSLVGFTGMPVVVKVTQMLLMAAWSLAEAIADTKALIEGKKVETIKNGDDWYISLMALKNFGKEKLGESTLDKGLGYEDYLRLLLILEAKVPQRYRSLDMIQADMCLRENKDFRVSECIVSSDINVSFEAPQLFVAYPFARGISGALSGNYGFEKKISYSY